MICTNCKKEFSYEVHEMHVPGGKDREDILCPYCNTQNGSVITDGWVRSYRIEEIKEKKEKLETDPIKNTVFHKRVRTKEEMEAIDAEVESKIKDGAVKLALFGAATSEAI